MQVLLQPMRKARQPDTDYARERAAAQAEVTRIRRAKRRRVLGIPLRVARKLATLLRSIPAGVARLSR
ncbi:hypothetical protein [Alloyangia pacifica]|uniref:Uncharacterized protein n=1 Tax=Alloyangia pacifica TaxID=311180 RepID=A0A1I6NX70_9RHOB|nr:hypothetical protein [Alloyangia pacifica]SDH58074.1 hypothetical protein SAMN04488245_108146 [Alloyangia pacifica]SFS32475.1 hypothetical protein SAMN04488050_101157 [Alloyangia pacifica]